MTCSRGIPYMPISCSRLLSESLNDCKFAGSRLMVALKREQASLILAKVPASFAAAADLSGFGDTADSPGIGHCALGAWKISNPPGFRTRTNSEIYRLLASGGMC